MRYSEEINEPTLRLILLEKLVDALMADSFDFDAELLVPSLRVRMPGYGAFDVSIVVKKVSRAAHGQD